MRDWFLLHHHPDNEAFVQLCHELNNGPVRQQRHKVCVPKLKVWWRNEKQRLKKMESRSADGTSGGNVVEGVGVVKKKRGRKPKAKGVNQQNQQQQPTGASPGLNVEGEDPFMRSVVHGQSAGDLSPDRHGLSQQPTHQGPQSPFGHMVAGGHLESTCGQAPMAVSPSRGGEGDADHSAMTSTRSPGHTTLTTAIPNEPQFGILGARSLSQRVPIPQVLIRPPISEEDPIGPRPPVTARPVAGMVDHMLNSAGFCPINLSHPSNQY